MHCQFFGNDIPFSDPRSGKNPLAQFLLGMVSRAYRRLDDRDLPRPTKLLLVVRAD